MKNMPGPVIFITESDYVVPNVKGLPEINTELIIIWSLQAIILAVPKMTMLEATAQTMFSRVTTSMSLNILLRKLQFCPCIIKCPVPTSSEYSTCSAALRHDLNTTEENV